MAPTASKNSAWFSLNLAVPPTWNANADDDDWLQQPEWDGMECTVEGVVSDRDATYANTDRVILCEHVSVIDRRKFVGKYTRHDRHINNSVVWGMIRRFPLTILKRMRVADEYSGLYHAAYLRQPLGGTARLVGVRRIASWLRDAETPDVATLDAIPRTIRT